MMHKYEMLQTMLPEKDGIIRPISNRGKVKLFYLRRRYLFLQNRIALAGEGFDPIRDKKEAGAIKWVLNYFGFNSATVDVNTQDAKIAVEMEA